MTCMDYIDPNVHCPKKAVKLNHSLIHFFKICILPLNSFESISLMINDFKKMFNIFCFIDNSVCYVIIKFSMVW